MIYGLFVLFAFQAFGELIKIATGTMLPGGVIGLLLLFALMVIRGGVPRVVGEASTRMIGLLPLLLTPASAGLFFLAELLHGKGYAVVVAVLVGTVVTLTFVALTMTWLIRLFGKETV